MPNCILKKTERQHAGRISIGRGEASSQRAVSYLCNIQCSETQGGSASPAASLRMLQLQVLILLGAGLEISDPQEGCCYAPALLSSSLHDNEEVPSTTWRKRISGKEIPLFLFPLLNISSSFCPLCCILSSMRGASSTSALLGEV